MIFVFNLYKKYYRKIEVIRRRSQTNYSDEKPYNVAQIPIIKIKSRESHLKRG